MDLLEQTEKQQETLQKGNDLIIQPEQSQSIKQSKKKPVDYNIEDYARKDGENIFDYINRVGQDKADEYNANVDRYAIRLRPEEYADLNDAINVGSVPQENAFKIAAAMKYANLYDIPVDEAYKNIDAFTYSLFGDDFKGYKSSWKAFCDSVKMGKNTLDIGFLGVEMNLAESRGDKDKVKELQEIYKKIQEENNILQQNLPPNVFNKILQSGGQSAPFTLGAIGTALINPIVGLAFSSAVMAGQEYIELREMGTSHELASGISAIAGALEGIVEVSLGTVAGAIGAKAGSAVGKLKPAETLRRNVIDRITNSVAEKMHYSGGWRIVANVMLRTGLQSVEEGSEEVVQECISLLGKHIANSAEDLGVESMTADEIMEDLRQNFEGGFYGSILLGSGTFIFNSLAAKSDYDAIRNAARIIPSEESFRNTVQNSVAFANMDETTKNRTIHEIYQNINSHEETDIEDLSEVYTAAEHMEVFETETDENGNETEVEEVAPESRDENGRLYSQQEELTENEDGTYKGRKVFGDATKEDDNQYGYISYTVDENAGTVTIDEFKTNNKRANLRNEMFADFAADMSDYDIKWNPKGRLAQSIKNEIEAMNPSGQSNGLNYFKQGNNAQSSARMSIARELRENLSKSKVTNEMISPLIAEMEALGKTFDMTIDEFYNTIFGGKIFGDTSVAEDIAQKQGGMHIRGGISIDDKAGTVQGLRAVIYAAENADFSTFSHELAHLGRRMIQMQGGELLDEMNKAFNITEEGWTRAKEEEFAEGFENFLHTGEAKTPGLKNLFKKIAEFLVRTYHSLYDRITLSEDMKAVYNQLLTGDESVLHDAENAVAQMTSESIEETADTGAEENATQTEETTTTETEQKQNETEQAVRDTRLDEVTQDALTSILEDESLTVDQKDNAIMNAVGESYQIKQENIERYNNRTDLTEEEKAAAIDDIMNNRTTDRDGGGFPFSTLDSGKDMLFQIIGEKGILKLDQINGNEFLQDNLDRAVEMTIEGASLDEIKEATGMDIGADGKWRYEIPALQVKKDNVFKARNYDDSMRLIIPADGVDESGKEYWNITPKLKLQDLMSDNNHLFDIYPGLRLVDIVLDKNLQARGQADGTGINGAGPYTIRLNSNYFQDNGDGTYTFIDNGDGVILHEIQHIIQHEEGFALGGTPYMFVSDGEVTDEAIERYRRIAGEVEARNVQTRAKLSMEQRRKWLLSDTEDRARDIQEVLYQEDIVSNSITDQILFQYSEEKWEEARQELAKMVSLKEYERIWTNLNNPDIQNTPWADQCIASIMLRKDMLAVMNGADIPAGSFLSTGAPKALAALKKGLDGIQEYLGVFDTSIVGTTRKAIWAVNSSLLNCNPSKDCAKYCYATDYLYRQINSMLKSEMVTLLVENRPEKAAELAAERFKHTPGYKAGQVLRLFDKGDMSEKWAPFIEKLNDKGIPCQIFSKRPELLSSIDPTKNVIMLSIDKSNEYLAEQYPDLPIAFVYSGPQDKQFLLDNEARFLKHGGVILPVKLNHRFLSVEEMAPIPKALKGFTCPIDAGKAEIGTEPGQYNCQQCDLNGNVGCYKNRGRETRPDMISFDDLTIDEFFKITGEMNSETNKEFQEELRNQLKGLFDQVIQNRKQKVADKRNRSMADAYQGREEGLDGRLGNSSEGTQAEAEVDKNTLFQNELENVRKQYANTDGWMKSPSGAKTNLNEEQWLQVRTPSFKNWFGDWINDPANSSKAVDENGEPLPVYHGSPSSGFNTFNSELNFFSDEKKVAQTYEGRGSTYSVYLNLRNPKIIDFQGAFYNGEFDDHRELYYTLPDGERKRLVLENGQAVFARNEDFDPIDSINQIEGTSFESEMDLDNLEWRPAQNLPYSTDSVSRQAKADGYDGVIIKNVSDNESKDTGFYGTANDYVVFDPAQIKSATDNSGAFDPNDPNILFQTAYHGTTADFDAFDLNYGLSGEGSMSFGYGVYVTDSEAIARDYATRQQTDKNGSDIEYQIESTKGIIDTYQEKLANFPSLEEWQADIQQSIVNVKKRIEERKTNNLGTEILESILNAKEKKLKPEAYFAEKKTTESVIKQAERDIEELNAKLEEIRSKGEIKRHLYTVEIPDKHLIQWDKNVRRQSIDKISYALFRKLAYEPNEYGEYDYKGVETELKRELDNVFDNEYTGQSLYGTLASYLGGDKNASIFLSSIGYKGIEYPAGTNFGTPDGQDARNFVIFREQDAQILNNVLFQKEIDQEILNTAAAFNNWVEFKEYVEAVEPELSPDQAAADWYLNTWEIAHNASPTTAEREAQILSDREEQNKNEKKDPVFLDGLFMHEIQKEGILENFLKRANDIENITDEEINELDEEERAYVLNELQKVKTVLSHPTIKSARRALINKNELIPSHRQRVINLIKGRIRDYRAVFADITGRTDYAVDQSESLDAELVRRARRFSLIQYDSEVENMSPEQKRALEKYVTDKEVLKKFREDKVQMDDPDVEHYIKMLETQIKNIERDLGQARREFQDDMESLGNMQSRDILKEYQEFLNLKNEADQRKIQLPAGSTEAVRLGERAQRDNAVGMRQSYNTLAAKWDTFKKETEAKIKLQERLRAEGKLSELEEKIKAEYDAKRMKTLMAKADKLNAMNKEYNDRRKEQAAARQLKDMRKTLVKRVMRRVNFSNIDYNQAKQIIAIQKVFEPNLRGGINKWIGTENKLAREIWSAWNTDEEAKEKMLTRLTNKAKYSIIKLLEDTQTEDDFDQWTEKQKKALEKAMPRQDWIRDLNLDVWKEERDNALQLPIKEVERYRWEIQPDGSRKQVNYTAIEMTPEMEQLIAESLGQDMAYSIQNKHFEDWTTGEMEELAKRINTLFKKGRDMLNARRIAENQEADRIRNVIRKNINTTGIHINEDDSPEVKKKKQAKIDKILGIEHSFPGTAASIREKQQTGLDRVLHGYHDANIRRVARILDNLDDGMATQLLYFRENDCFNKEARSKDRRNNRIQKVIDDNKLDMRKLGNVMEFFGSQWTVDEILMLHAAKMNQEDYRAEQLKDNATLEEKDILEESSWKAIKYGNLITPEEREDFRRMDDAILEAEKTRIDNLHAAELAGNEEAIKMYSQIPSDMVDMNGNLLMAGTVALKSRANQRMDAILLNTESLRKEFQPLIDAIRADYAAEFDNINRVSIEEFNAPVWREKWYLPLVRLTASGDTHEQRLRQDLLGHSAGTGKAGTEKGFTKKRVEIGPKNQAPVELGLYKTWADSVERNEHFIAYAGYVRELNRVLFSRDALGTMQEIENRYGHAMKEYLDSYVKEVANPQRNEPKKGLDKVMHILRGNTAPAYLGWKFSSILKQGIESPAPFMQFVNPVEYMHAAVQMATNREIRDGIERKSAFMKSRVFDPIIDLVNENVEKSLNKPEYILKKIQQKGMSGLEWIDYACVAPGWLAVYNKEYARLQATENQQYQTRLEELTEQNETRNGQYHLTEEQLQQMAHEDVSRNIEEAAILKADDCVRLCQPSNRQVDLAPMFKNNSEAAKAVLQFQTALNVIWQNIRYDIPYAMKKGEYKQVVGMLLGYLMAGIMSGVVCSGLGKDDDDPEELAKKLGYYATTQFLDSVPIVGGNLDRLAERAITGEGGPMLGNSLWPTFDKYYNAANSFIKEDYDKAVDNVVQGLVLTLGLPLSGGKEAAAVLGIGDGDGELDLNLEALTGRR